MTNPSQEKIKNCPCCGESVELEDGNEGIAYTPSYFIRCPNCGLSTDTNRSEAVVISTWNTRPDEALLQQALEALKYDDGCTCNIGHTCRKCKTITALQARLGKGGV